MTQLLKPAFSVFNNQDVEDKKRRLREKAKIGAVMIGKALNIHKPHKGVVF